MDPGTTAVQQDLEEAFESIVILEPRPTPPDDDWMPGEYDIA